MITKDGALEIAYWNLHETKLKYRKLFFEWNDTVSLDNNLHPLTLKAEIKRREYIWNEMCRCLYKVWVLRTFINKYENRTIYFQFVNSCPWWWRDKGGKK